MVSESPATGPFLLREARPDDMAWVVRRHRELYTREHGWGETFAGLVADSAAAIARDLGTARAAGWIAEVRGEPAGCVFVTRESEAEAKLRLLLVEPSARGLGVGAGLVDACIRFAREGGYRRMTLWTNEVLHAARRIYAARGFRVIRTERQDAVFGHLFVAETWALDLRDPPGERPPPSRHP